ncbi:hypothetical protein DW667_04110 [Coprococcus sp. AM25-15LB]|uniref:Uncharacterized protein n=1 Tax=Faecalimonas umbilicata TaxID=1912855 RepID=A0ABQ0R0M3_9FIRM|nr:hypothetical protein DW667_04110 [Coprococcus sp. AM25-15LB]RJW09963.1 hypothetical protein DW686_04110 [Coprococcus sp. AM25-4LB]GBU06188.1 hypothetical protein FAEUMB_27290 [Faecalimonas umbilicata]
MHVHHDRSVPERIYTEILSKLAEFPEHLRLMFLQIFTAVLSRKSEKAPTFLYLKLNMEL